MSLALDDLPRDPDWLLQQLRQVAEVAATERSRNIALEIERDTVRAEGDAAAAEIEKLRLLIRQLQRNRFGRRSERLEPRQPPPRPGGPQPRHGRPRAAPARPGGPRADCRSRRGGAGGCRQEQRYPSAAPLAPAQPGRPAGAP